MMLRKALLSGLLAACLVNLFYYYQSFDSFSHSTVTSVVQPIKPDAYGKQITMTRYTIDGNIHSQLSAPKLQLYSEQQLAILDHPTIRFNHDAHIWNVQAQHGKYSTDSEKLDLAEKVNIWEVTDIPAAAIHCATETLKLDSKEGIATTADPVVITRSKTILTGVGMEIDLKNSTLSLADKVNLYHEGE
jgi:LPS export ABC transporter protein LptC